MPFRTDLADLANEVAPPNISYFAHMTRRAVVDRFGIPEDGS